MNSKKNPALSWKVYCIIDKKILRADPVNFAHSLFKKGVKVLQLRYKNSPSYELVPIAKKIQSRARQYGATLLVNDRVDVALASGAGGVHLGAGDISSQKARMFLQPGAIVGKTVHSSGEARKTKREKIDYVSAGPIFRTPLKKVLKGQGKGFVKRIKRCVSHPVLAIGGINKKNSKDVFRAGASGICVTRAASLAKELLKK